MRNDGRRGAYMLMFSATDSPGQRWKMFLPDAPSMSVTVASAVIRSRWLAVRTRRKLPAAVWQCGTLPPRGTRHGAVSTPLLSQ
jgi:hypothetical protein